MAFEANLSDFTIYAYTVDLNQKVQPLNVNFLDFFWIFLSHLIRRNGKMSGEGLKVEKVAKWATLGIGVAYPFLQGESRVIGCPEHPTDRS